MEPNDYQIVGRHYSNTQVQHWDFVIANNLNYLLGCATKYIIRWKNKNGIEDLRKAVHYLAKTQERCIYHYNFEEHTQLMALNNAYAEFFNGIGDEEKDIILKILQSTMYYFLI